MSDPWLLVVTVGAATIVLRGVVPAVLAGRPPRRAAAGRDRVAATRPLLAVIAVAAATTALARTA